MKKILTAITILLVVPLFAAAPVKKQASRQLKTEAPWGQPKYGRIPKSVFIPYYDLFTPENLAKLQKNKKIILVGHMGIHENYSVVPLRLLGYDAYALLLGMSGWQKDYPATSHLKMLIHAPDNMEFPLEQEAEGHMMHQKHKGH